MEKKRQLGVSIVQVHVGRSKGWKVEYSLASWCEQNTRTRTMTLTYIRSLRNVNLRKEVIQIGGCRTFAVGKKKGGKGGAAGDAPKASSISKEVKASTVVGANILKDGADPKVLPDSEYPNWLWHLLDKRPALSELRRKGLESLPYDDLKRFVKLDTRARIKENNSVRAKN